MAAPTLGGGSFEKAAPYSTRSARRRNRSLFWACSAIVLLVVIYYTHEPAVAVYHKAKDNWRPFKSIWQQYATSRVQPQHTSTQQAAVATPSGEPIPPDVVLDHSNPRSRLPSWMKDILEWEPPVWAWLHAPSYAGWNESDYDPNRWEAFPKNNELFLSNTVQNGTSSEIYRPYPDYNSEAWRRRWRGEHVACEGFSGLLYNESDKDVARAFKRKRTDLGKAFVSNHEAVGLRGDICFDRYSRLGPFGAVQDGDIDFSKVNLGEMQKKCVERNKDRFDLSWEPNLRPPNVIPPQGLPFKHPSTDQNKTTEEPTTQPRTAILIRAWEDYHYEENDIHAIRSLASELTLQTGGEYQVLLFVMLKDNRDVGDHSMLNDAIQSVPEELRDMTVFWSEDVGQRSYPLLGEWRVHEAQYLGVQWFMSHHPQFEYVWNWEMDARLIGHHYEFLERMVDFSRNQPRKYLWERNARFYLPEVHGTWEEFFNDTNEKIENSHWVRPVWGEQYHNKVGPLGEQPPVSIAHDNYEWGVGEEADFISLLPIWDPAVTHWGWKRTVRGYNDDPLNIPRRAYINTHARYSRRLLHAMHLENQAGRNMHAELWPTTVALHHGLKAVYAPQPIWAMQDWPADYADAVFNADGWSADSFRNLTHPYNDIFDTTVDPVRYGRGRAYDEARHRAQLPQLGTGPTGEGALARWGQEHDSIYAPDREHNFFGWSWYFKCDGAPLIYWRWLGWKQRFSVFTMGWDSRYDEFPDVGSASWEQSNGRLCMPTMMLHPVKGVKKTEDELKEEAEVKEGIAKAAAEAAEVAAAGGGPLAAPPPGAPGAPGAAHP